MKGSIVITVGDTSDTVQINVRPDIRDASVMEKFMLVDALMNSLKFSREEFEVFTLLRAAGVFKDSSECISVSSEFLEYLKRRSPGGDSNEN